MRRVDPMVRLLLLAMFLATVLPVGGRWAGVAQFVSNAAVFLLFFLNGLRLPRREVIAGIGKWRLLVPLVAFVYMAMPAAGWLLWQSTGHVLPPLLALGFLFLGTLPSTVQSATAYTSLAGGNVASSVVAAALINIIGVFVTAPLFALLAGSSAAGFDGAGLIKVMTILLLPFALGQALQGRLGGWISGHRHIHESRQRDEQSPFADPGDHLAPRQAQPVEEEQQEHRGVRHELRDARPAPADRQHGRREHREEQQTHHRIDAAHS